MKNLTHAFIVLLLPIFLSGCKTSGKNILSNTNNLKASCDIQNITLSQLECAEFYLDYSGNSETFCDEAQDRHSLSLKSHRDSKTAASCTPLAKIASCKLSGHTVFFYEEGYTAGEAQTECNSMGGTFEQ